MTSGIALVATGVAVAGAVVVTDQPPAEAAVIAGHTDEQPSPADTNGAVERAADRTIPASRSARRSPVETTNDAPRRRTNSDPRQIAREMMPEFGFSSSEFSCLDALYVSESDWDMHADNPTSSAYGIPQALDSAHDLPADYRTNPATQIRWGLGYIRDSYGTPCAAWNFKQSNDWY